MRSLLAAIVCFSLAAQADEDAVMLKRIQDLLHAHQEDVFGCVSQQPKPPAGEMLVQVIVGEGGKVGATKVLKDQSGSAALGPCLVGKIGKWDLASLQAAAGDQVVFPLVFRPEKLAKGERRVLIPMGAQEVSGSQRFLIDDESVGEAPLLTMDMLTLQPNQSSPAKVRTENEEELVLYVVEGTFAVGTDTIAAGDALWLGAKEERPALKPEGKKPLKLLEIRGHGTGTGTKIARGATAKAYPVGGPQASVKLLLDGIGHVALDEIVAEPRVAIPPHKHQSEDEVLFMLAGKTSTTVGKQTFETAPGDVMRIPANTTHSMKVGEALRAIQVYAPAGPEQRFKGEPPKKKSKKK
jgi:quercetin dioxygenase-like cupin family protein